MKVFDITCECDREGRLVLSFSFEKISEIRGEQIQMLGFLSIFLKDLTKRTYFDGFVEASQNGSPWAGRKMGSVHRLMSLMNVKGVPSPKHDQFTIQDLAFYWGRLPSLRSGTCPRSRPVIPKISSCSLRGNFSVTTTLGNHEISVDF